MGRQPKVVRYVSAHHPIDHRRRNLQLQCLTDHLVQISPGLQTFRVHRIRHQGKATEVQRHVKQGAQALKILSLIHISEPTRLRRISYAVFCLKKKKTKTKKKTKK